jgi:hypothetical protein
MDNKSIIYLGILVVVLFSLVFLVRTSDEIGSPGTSYNYTGVDDKDYLFNVTQIGSNIRHVLDYRFVKNEGGTSVERGVMIPFRYSPMELESIYMVDDFTSEILSAEVIYVTREYSLDEYTNQLDGIAMLTFIRVVDDVTDPDLYEIPTGMAITNAVEGLDSPVVSCEYSNIEARVIELRLGTENRIYWEGECIVMEFVEPEDSIKVATKLTYHVLGIM